MKSIFFLLGLAALVIGGKTYSKIERLQSVVIDLRTQNDQLSSDLQTERARLLEMVRAQDDPARQEIIDRLSNERERAIQKLTDANISQDRLHSQMAELKDQLQRNAGIIDTLEAALAANKAANVESRAASVASTPRSNDQPRGTSSRSLRDRMRSKLRLANTSQTIMVEHLDAELSSGATLGQVLADPAERAAVARSPLAQELIAVYQNDADAFDRAEAQEPVRPVPSISPMALAHLRKEINDGAKATELISDP
jgi:outer membrane murein-binding lipoprotein Lpp